MAILVPGPLASEVRNSIGDTTYQVNRGKQIVRKRPITPRHDTPAAEAAKNGFFVAVESWRGMKANTGGSLYWPMFRLGKKNSTAVSVWHRTVRLYQSSEGADWTLPVEDPSRRVIFNRFVPGNPISVVDVTYVGGLSHLFVGLVGSLLRGGGQVSQWHIEKAMPQGVVVFVPRDGKPYSVIIVPIEPDVDLKQVRLGDGFITELPILREV